MDRKLALIRQYEDAGTKKLLGNGADSERCIFLDRFGRLATALAVSFGEHDVAVAHNCQRQTDIAFLLDLRGGIGVNRLEVECRRRLGRCGGPASTYQGARQKCDEQHKEITSSHSI